MVGDVCKKSEDCKGDMFGCSGGYCVFAGDTQCTNCDACGLPGTRGKPEVCKVGGKNWPNIPTGSAPGCYSIPKDGCKPDENGNVKCSSDCPCYTCSAPPKTCPVAEDPTDISSICLVGAEDNTPIPSNKCYNLDGKNYDCAARVPWGPGGLWIGGLMYKFWKDAGESPSNKSIYVSMYSSFDDAGTGCIMNCNDGSTGGNSAWSEGVTTSSQYVGSNRGAIDSTYWYSKADSNSVQNVIDFLNKQGSVHLLRGQWSNLGTDEAFTTFKNIGKDSYQVKLFLAQKKQITKDGGNGTVTTKTSKDGNPDNVQFSQRNHSKVYISKDSIASCSGHPYNGGIQDWGGINEVMLVENCPNACRPVRSNWEMEFKYGEELKNASTFPWASGWANQKLAVPPKDTSMVVTEWSSGSKKGGMVKVV